MEFLSDRVIDRRGTVFPLLISPLLLTLPLHTRFREDNAVIAYYCNSAIAVSVVLPLLCFHRPNANVIMLLRSRRRPLVNILF